MIILKIIKKQNKEKIIAIYISFSVDIRQAVTISLFCHRGRTVRNNLSPLSPTTFRYGRRCDLRSRNFVCANFPVSLLLKVIADDSIDITIVSRSVPCVQARRLSFQYSIRDQLLPVFSSGRTTVFLEEMEGWRLMSGSQTEL